MISYLFISYFSLQIDVIPMKWKQTCADCTMICGLCETGCVWWQKEEVDGLVGFEECMNGHEMVEWAVDYLEGSIYIPCIGSL